MYACIFWKHSKLLREERSNQMKKHFFEKKKRNIYRISISLINHVLYLCALRICGAPSLYTRGHLTEVRLFFSPTSAPSLHQGTVIATSVADPTTVQVTTTPQAAYYQQQPQQVLSPQQMPPPSALQFNPPPPGTLMHHAAATRPYLTAADFAYTDPAAYQALMQPRAAGPPPAKYPAKRPIRMQRRDRAPKAFRTAADGMNYALPRPDDVSSGEN